MKDKILSIQSKLVYGYVGNNIAELAIQLHGLDVIAFPTVYLSAHTGHQPSYGMRVDKKLFDDLIIGIQNLNIMDSVAHIISGYIGTAEIIDSTAGFIRKVKADFPDKLYICDPVMGDEEGLYLDEMVANAIIEQLLPLSDVITPNHFEFEYIVGQKARSEGEIMDAIIAHPVLRDKIVIVTSSLLPDTAEDEIDTLIVKGVNCKRVTTKRAAIDTTGTGDLFTAVVASQLTLGKDIISAVTVAAQMVKRALDMTSELGNKEMNAHCLVDAIGNYKL